VEKHCDGNLLLLAEVPTYTKKGVFMGGLERKGWRKVREEKGEADQGQTVTKDRGSHRKKMNIK